VKKQARFVKKTAVKAKTFHTPVRKKALAASMLTGYKRSPKGLYVPQSTLTTVPPSKFRTGFAKAKKEISGLIEEIISTMTEEYIIREIELSASFNADGKFMGFGVGGAATITIRISPGKGEERGKK
jgi:hypothetical protein